MQVRGRHLLDAFGKKHVAAVAPLRQWDRVVSVLTINRPEQWTQHLSKVSTVGRRCTVFNIGGNKYRISATVDYEFQVIRVHRVMTHKEYDEINRQNKLCS